MMVAYGFVDTYNGESQKGLFRFHVPTPPADSLIIINSLTRDLSGVVTINFTKTTNVPVVLQGTQDFMGWAKLGTNTQAAGTYNILDATAVNFDARFYRFKIE